MSPSAAPVSVPVKSTTVRSIPLGFRVRRWGVQALASVAPGAAEEQVAALFFRPRRRPALPPEVAGHEARPFEVWSEGVRLAAWSFGEGPAVLLVHGWESRAADLAAFVAPFVEAGRRVIVFDQPGHGASGGREVDLPQMARAVRAVVEVVGPLDGVVGHSLGGAAVGLAIARGLPVRRAVLVAPTVEPDAFAQQLGAAFGFDAERTGNVIRRVYARFGRAPGEFALDRDVRDAEVPLLVVHDVDDREVPFAHGERLASAWPGAVLERVQGLGHRRIIRDAGVVQRAVAFVLDGGAPVRDARELVWPRG